MKGKIIIITDGDFWGQSYNTWKSIDIELFTQFLNKGNIKVEKILLSDIIKNFSEINDCYVLYTASVDLHVLEYIKGAIWALNKKNVVIPSYEQLLCLENKGFQEIYKSRYNLQGLKSNYYKSIQDIDLSSIKYPVVFKKIDGAGSKYVSLIRKKSDLIKTFRGMKGYWSFLRYYLLIARKYLLVDNKDFIEYKKYHYPKMNFILQEFVEDLKYDYKALVFFDKIYLLKRMIKPKDFRASGSGEFLFVTESPKQGLLDYIYEVYCSLDCPFVSLDVVEKNNKYYLIEFQFSHFGPYTLQQSSGFFSKEDDWRYISSSSILELELANSYLSYISQIKQ